MSALGLRRLGLGSSGAKRLRRVGLGSISGTTPPTSTVILTPVKTTIYRKRALTSEVVKS